MKVVASSSPGREAPSVIHVIDHVEPGGAQHILAALTESDPSAAVVVLHARGGEGELMHQFPAATILSRHKYAAPWMLLRLVRMIFRYRKQTLFNAHLEGSTLFMCALRRLIDFRLLVTLHARQEQWSKGFVRVFRRIIFWADHVIPESRRVNLEMAELGIRPERMSLIPIGTRSCANGGAQPTTDVRAEFSIAESTPVFLNIARMVPGKGQIHLVRAMAQVPDAVAIIVGDGPEEQRLRLEVERLDLARRVFFAGRRTDLHNFYPIAHAFVMPCVDESMGIVIYDALTFQLPVIAFDSGSIGEIVSDGQNGLLLPVDANLLADALRRVLQPSMRFSFLPASHYSAATMVERHQMLYRRLRTEWQLM